MGLCWRCRFFLCWGTAERALSVAFGRRAFCVAVCCGAVGQWRALDVGAVVMGGLLFAACVLLQTVSRGRQTVANAAHSRKLNWLADVLLTRESLADPRAASVAVAGMRTPSQIGARAASKARLWSLLVRQMSPVGMALTSALTLVVGVFLIEAQTPSVGGSISSTLLAGRMVAAMCGLAPVLSRGQEFRRAVQGLNEAVNLDAPAIDVLATDAARSNAFALEGLRLEGVAFLMKNRLRRTTRAAFFKT